MKKFTKNLLRQVVVPEARSALSSPPLPRARFFPQRPPSGKVPVQARSRSDNYAAVLGLQKTQPKDRRIYTAHTGILAEPGAHRMAGQRITGRQNHRYDGTGIMNSN